MQPSRSVSSRLLAKGIATLSFCALIPSLPAFAQQFTPGNLVVSRSVYESKANTVKVGTILPPNCATTLGACSASTGAPYNGTYPQVFNDVLYDPAFGITSKIYLDQLAVEGTLINTLEIPSTGNKKLVTSFSSKSEIGLNLSLDNKFITFMGYVAAPNTVDVSNSNTPGAIDPTNPDGQVPTYRAVARINKAGDLTITETDAYSGNNGRVAILNNYGGDEFYYTAGNAGDGANPQPYGVVAGAGAQIITPVTGSEVPQAPGLPTPVASFSIAQLGVAADKIGKDDNFRGMTVFNNVLYYTKGSGSNGVNTVYFVDTVGGACPNGIGLPKPGAPLPTTSIPYSTTTLATTGLPSNMCILAGFPSTPAKTAKTPSFPFGLFFANENTLYVADEGNGTFSGTTPYAAAAAQTTAGLQKWVFNPQTQLWSLAYTLNSGLKLGIPYTVANYPTGNNPATNLPWAPATDGIRNIAGAVGVEGTVAVIYAITSTVSGGGDQGADPNKLVAFADLISNTSPAVGALMPFMEIKDAGFAEVLRGVTFTPGTVPAKLKLFHQ
ncbi:hypothetical protein [Granulicella arctica]|uniref:hypothetical protein n=1 Tax=Granulicella arctica TaxID=940613 RepID=UPI0021DFAF8E|nr:hypothetical protein [Granulicella arctica]